MSDFGAESGFNKFYKALIPISVAIGGLFIASIGSYFIGSKNYNAEVLRLAKEGDFTPFIGMAEYYYETDNIKEDELGFALYGQLFFNDEGDANYYTMVFYGFENNGTTTNDIIRFTCNGEIVEREYSRKSEYYYNTYSFSDKELSEECGVGSFVISDITYLVDGESVLEISNDYSLDYDRDFYEENGEMGLNESDFSEMVKGTNLTVYKIVTYAVIIAAAIVVAFSVFNPKK